jgi:site-specific DNA-adenine methylase
MTHFPLVYFGNKRKEVDEILKGVDVTAYDTIVEPFAGSSAVSFACWQRGFNGLFVINDTDPMLMKMYEFVRKNGITPLFDYCNENCNEDVWKEHHAKRKDPDRNVFEWFYQRKMTTSYGWQKMPKEWKVKRITKKMLEFEEFLKTANIHFSCDDYSNVIEKHKKNTKAMIFLDPPYFQSHNQQYHGNLTSHDDIGDYNDGTKMFCDFADLFESKEKIAHVILVVNAPALLVRVYKKFIRSTYLFTYSLNIRRGKEGSEKIAKNKANHIIVDSRFVEQPPEQEKSKTKAKKVKKTDV